MPLITEFVAASLEADPSLAGTTDKDKAAISLLDSETDSLSKDLSALNTRLTPITYLYHNTPSTADISLYCRLHPTLASAPASQHPSHPSVLRYFLQVQSIPPVTAAQKSHPNSFPPLEIDISTLPPPPREVIAPVKKEKKEKKAAPAPAPAPEAGGVVASAVAAVESAAGAVASAASDLKNAVVGGAVSETKKEGGAPKDGKKKEKKEKPAKTPVVKEEPTGPMPSMIDMRVGKVLDVKKHPEADSLYVEQIDVGEAEPRTVCSGLVKYMKEEDILGQTIIVICNLKPVTMRGVKSYAMLLCASQASGTGEKEGVEFVLPPAESVPGERIYFEGEKYESQTPEAQLNPKKKIFETIQPGFITLDNLDAAWIDPETKSVHKIRTKDGVCKAKSFVGASLS